MAKTKSKPTHSSSIQSTLNKVMLAMDEVEQMKDRIWEEQLNEQISYKDQYHARDHLDLAHESLESAMISLSNAQDVLS